MAIPALISGEVYDGNMEKEEYVKNILDKNKFFNGLDNEDFSVELHTIREYCNKSKVINCSPISAGNAGFDYLKFIDLSLFRIVPDISKPLVFNEGAWLLSSYFKKDINFSSHNVFGDYLFDKFNNSISVEDGSRPTYKFFHSLLTHSPMVLDSACNFRKDNELQLLYKMNSQEYCGFNHVLNLLNKLKKLGIYDETMIILSSDHGSTYSSDKLSNVFLSENINPLHYSMSLATVMIKPFHSRGKLQSSSVPVSLHDIPKTILDESSIKNKLQGKNIFKLSKSDKRERIYYFYDWTKESKFIKKLPPFKTYKVTGEVNKVGSWFNLNKKSTDVR